MGVSVLDQWFSDVMSKLSGNVYMDIFIVKHPSFALKNYLNWKQFTRHENRMLQLPDV